MQKKAQNRSIAIMLIYTTLQTSFTATSSEMPICTEQQIGSTLYTAELKQNTTIPTITIMSARITKKGNPQITLEEKQFQEARTVTRIVFSNKDSELNLLVFIYTNTNRLQKKGYRLNPISKKFDILLISTGQSHPRKQLVYPVSE